MFGLIISGRPVNATPTTISQTQYAFTIPPSSGPQFSHIVVFLLPGTQLPSDTAATVYIQLPPSPDFKLLGAIGTGKESAIFKINSSPSNSSNNPAAGGGGDIVIGLSIEPISQVEQQLSTLPSSTALVATSTGGTGGKVETKVLAQRIISNAFNFLASFGSDVVPLKAFQDWWVKFEKRVELDPSFLERVE